MDQHTAQHPSTHKNWYDKSYKLILILPVVLLVLSITYLAHFVSVNGDIIKKDISLTGGTTITVFSTHDVSSLKSKLSTQFPDIAVRTISDIQTGAQKGFFVETSAPVNEVKSALEKELGFALTPNNASIEFTGAALSSSFYQQLRLAVIIAFCAMGLVVFLIFRTTVPSLAVITAAFADIAMTLVAINILGMAVSVAGIVAFLMLIGYSVDTDILLTSRVLKSKEGSINHRIFGAFKTGLFMTLTAIIAVGVSLFFIGPYSDTLKHMFTIILIGLGFDIFNTWITNASLIKWYAEVKKL